MDEFLILAMAQIFEIPEAIMKDTEVSEWFLEELTSLLERVEVQAYLKKFMENEHWKYKRWYGKIEEENE